LKRLHQRIRGYGVPRVGARNGTRYLSCRTCLVSVYARGIDESAEMTDRSKPSDALCFTAGFSGAPFDAGVIHAYLAADRPAPAVVAGISVGAVSAAAMQRAYRELEACRPEPAGGNRAAREIARWRWCREYIEALSTSPLNVIWNSIPDRHDFFSDLPPVEDPAVPVSLRPAERAARRNLYLRVRLGVWLSALPIPIRRVAAALVAFVRSREQSPGSRTARMLRFLGSTLRATWPVVSHLAFSPQWVNERHFRGGEQQATPWHRRWIRPLFGWRLFLMSWLLVVAAAGLGATLLLVWWDERLALLTTIVTVVLATMAYLARPPMHAVMAHLDMERGLVHDFHLIHLLSRLFEQKLRGGSELLSNNPFPLVLVVAPLQELRHRDQPGTVLSAYQLWARPGRVPLVTALRAALAIPPILSPVVCDRSTADDWWEGSAPRLPLERLDVVNGAMIRQNPLPALFNFLRRNQPVAERLTSGTEAPRIHVVYSVPIAPVPLTADEQRVDPPDIVDVAMASVQLARRRDTQLEVLQTNFTSRLELRIGSPADGPEKLYPIFADEIAPEADISFENALSPSRMEILQVVAAGCRQSLQRLYGAQLAQCPGGTTTCTELLQSVAPDRPWAPGRPPGLPEVCRMCSGTLTAPPASSESNLSVRTTPERQLEEAAIAALAVPNGRIVFLASGGVFRGAFHVGMIAALIVSQTRPHLIVGASVGTLMGSALGAMLSTGTYNDAARLLGQLTLTFVHVDERISLTRVLKTAARELGIRGKKIDLSPNDIRRLVTRGTRADPGFAATGAPPALIDAISELFMIPHEQTTRIAAHFVAGHAARAINEFLHALKHETLERLGIKSAIMGSALLEITTRDLLGSVRGLDLGVTQPFKGCAFFGTTTNLSTRAPRLLPWGEAERILSYDLIEAALASSAFPCVFAPRRESDIFPGRGRIDVHFADGGMFDNLPFIPAIEVLSQAQLQIAHLGGDTALERLRRRYEHPDLFIAGSLEAGPETQPPAAFDELRAIHQRAMALQQNVKIRAFEDASAKVNSQIGRLIAAAKQPNEEDSVFIDNIVNVAVLPVFPTDDNHLNKTFAFCASMGLRAERVQLSIADGCFQTLRALLEGQRRGPADLAGRAVTTFTQARQIPVVDWSTGAPGAGKFCPYFRLSTRQSESHEERQLTEHDHPVPFTCPFAVAAEQEPADGCQGELEGVFLRCTEDRHHHRAREAGVSQATPAGPTSRSTAH
jgi:predicted acylesterase/phospholipase RssA